MSSPETGVRVLVVAGDPLARASLVTLLSDRPECVVVGLVEGELDLSSEVRALSPDVVLWDLGWDPGQAIDHLAGLADEMPPVLALLPDEAHAEEARIAGLRGLLFRNADSETLISAVLAVARGLVVLDPDLAPAPPTGGRAGEPLAEELTPRELEVLNLLAEGLPNKAIARELGISEFTVKFHVNSILGKLGARSRTEAVTRATRLGLILL